ncbi:Shedu anti-phage system protein SduA domain-containing protein, partial [Cronobacter sakazakii]|uniref:Shedu anti-phage system protein SduA domain-containing protein n=1 Tax=Cronobacter sakazakii TaxID=28141 RepID=UPI003F7A9C71
GEELFNFNLKSFLVVGNLSQFSSDNGINHDKLRSFENFRSNLIRPEVITFDELYERARFIVAFSENI